MLSRKGMIRPRPEQKAGGEENFIGEGIKSVGSPLEKQGSMLCGLQVACHGWLSKQ